MIAENQEIGAEDDVDAGSSGVDPNTFDISYDDPFKDRPKRTMSALFGQLDGSKSSSSSAAAAPVPPTVQNAESAKSRGSGPVLFQPAPAKRAEPKIEFS